MAILTTIMNKRSTGPSSLLALIIVGGILCITTALMTPCWLSRSYLLFNTSSGAEDAPNLTVCFGLDSYQTSTDNTPEPDTKVYYTPEMTDAIFNLSEFRHHGKSARGGLIFGAVLAYFALVFYHVAAGTSSPKTRRLFARCASVSGVLAGGITLLTSIWWAATVPSASDWYAPGGSNSGPTPSECTGLGQPCFSYYFTNAAYSLALACIGALLLIISFVLAPVCLPVVGEPGRDEGPLISRQPYVHTPPPPQQHYAYPPGAGAHAANPPAQQPNYNVTE